MNRALRTKEKRIHRHLYLAMLIQVVIRLILYVDQLVSRRGNDAIGDVKVRRTAAAAAAAAPAAGEDGNNVSDLVRGIDNTVRGRGSLFKAAVAGTAGGRRGSMRCCGRHVLSAQYNGTQSKKQQYRREREKNDVF